MKTKKEQRKVVRIIAMEGADPAEIARIAAAAVSKKAMVPRNISYLRVSGDDQETEKNKADVLKFVHERKFGTVEFVEEKVTGKKPWRERAIGKIIDDLQAGDRLILPEISRLGRSMLDIMSCLASAKERGIVIYDLKNGYELNGKFAGEVMAMLFTMAAQIERDLISARTKEGLQYARSQGRVGGRPKGPGKSKLDKHRKEIEELLRNGSPKTLICQRYGAAPPTLYAWLKKKKVDVVADRGRVV